MLPDDLTHPDAPGDAARPAVPLPFISAGQTVQLARVKGGKRCQHRLSEMGLTPGEIFTVINNSHPGPIIILVKETRLVIGRGMSHHIDVYPHPDQA